MELNDEDDTPQQGRRIMIRRYYKASATAKVAHIGPMRAGALDRSVCGHIIVAPPWQSIGVLADGSPALASVDVCRSCDRMKDADTMASHRAPDTRVAADGQRLLPDPKPHAPEGRREMELVEALRALSADAFTRVVATAEAVRKHDVQHPGAR